MAPLNIAGSKIRMLRESRNLTQEALVIICQRLGWDVSRVTLAKIETGARAINDAELVVFSEALNCKGGEIIDPSSLSAALKVVRQGKSGLEEK